MSASDKRCGYAVTDQEGEQGPCDQPATGWRWYQNVEHEDMLDAACDWHQNEGGQRIHEANEARRVVDAYFDLDADPWDDDGALPPPEDVWRFHRDLKAALTPTAERLPEPEPAEAAAERTSL